MDPEELDLIRDFHRAGIYLPDERRVSLATTSFVATFGFDPYARYQAQLSAGGPLAYAMQQSVRRLT